MNEISDLKKKKTAHYKAACSGRKEKSRHVQEPPRKDGKFMHLLKNKIKTWKLSFLSVFSHVCRNHLCLTQPVRSPFPDILYMS